MSRCGRTSWPSVVSYPWRCRSGCAVPGRLFLPKRSNFSVFQTPGNLRRYESRRYRERTRYVCASHQAPPPLIILPGFLVGASAYAKLAIDLEASGHFSAVEIVPIKRSDWVSVLAGGDFQYYLAKMEEVILPLVSAYGPCCLVGHSAGGWIARLFLGDRVPYQNKWYGHRDKVKVLVTLGTPHHSLEAYPFGRFDETIVFDDCPEDVPQEVRSSSLRYTNYFYPRGDDFPGVKVVCVAGNAITGRPLQSVADATLPEARSALLAYNAYKAACGNGCVHGDGVTPVQVAHLEGAYKNLELPGVWHGPVSKPGRPWYGDVAFDSWLNYALMD